MGVVVKPKNLNDRQMKRVDKIESPERAKKVADRISERRNARGAETAVKPIMKKGGKAQNGKEFGMLSVKAGIDKNPNPTQADRIAGAKGMAKSGKKVTKAPKKASYGKMMKGGGKCKNGC
jgi:hypothetical protein